MVVIYYSDDDSSYTDITEYSKETELERGTELTQNKFKIKLSTDINNVIDDDKWKLGMFFKIYDGSTILFKGLSTAHGFVNGNKYQVYVNGLDSSMDLFAGQRSVYYENEVASDIIIDLAAKFSGKEGKLKAALTTDGGYITPTTQTIDYFYGTHERFYYYLMKLCLSQNTNGSDNFYFYIDEENNLHYKPLTTTYSSISANNLKEYEIGQSTDKKFNHVIMNCGLDQDGNEITVYKTDLNSYTNMKGRLVSKVFDERWIAGKILKQNPTMTTAEQISASKVLGTERADLYLRYYGIMKQTLKLTIFGIPSNTINSVITTNIPQAVGKSWIIKKLKHVNKGAGWETLMNLEERII